MVIQTAKQLGMLKDLQHALQATEHGSHESALKELRHCSERALAYLQEGNTPLVQEYMETAFTHLLSSFHFLNLDLDKVVNRLQQKQLSVKATDRVILIFGNHAELRVDGQCRGTMPLYAEEDYAEVRQIAQIFQCRIEHADHVQLDIFGKPRQ
jgi:phosphoribosyl-ATP pyrophosphohydrolase